jgi:SAM-dependent methyltransferase
LNSLRPMVMAATRARRVRSWLPLFALSWRLGIAALARGGPLKAAVLRIVVPLDPSRYLELPHSLRQLDARPGQAVIDLASPKLVAVALARSGVNVTSVDALESEVETWRRLAPDEPRLSLQCGDGRQLPCGNASFDHGYSISVLEHIPDDGDEQALGELARVVRPGGRVVLTMPYAESYWEDWRETPVYGSGGERPGRHFFERWYDRARVDRLLAAAPGLREVHRSVVSMSPDLHRLYTRAFPWLIPLGPFFGLAAREREGRQGDVIRLTLVKEG